ncbi:MULTISPECIES: hypothetical protein [Halomonadaceae]|uniref:Uncharacterized protein n=1 Tax=Vreelandella titanicae TaxID=664683 RepID=A0A558J1E7_9GAMM|nr:MULTISPECIES: hypothetical protein [Halomonas]EHA15301.1 hypothetical protein HAL1_12319 [Halomonas sp. HAL1]TVU87374.1 hypothetical protein FQP89_22615 [Halomonas titanicae]WKV95244.1 hypothetical protein Q3Y66_20310 [Halomonas sp. HAL1]|tara:strand:- start:473 stop:694 length:222 start_codon:yes stop_codon:yes gene_type:complete
MNSDTLIKNAQDELSLLSRLVVDRATMREGNGKLTLLIDEEGARLLTMERVRQEIECAVKKAYGLEVAYERAS